MLWVISCIAKPDIGAVRKLAAEAHKVYLDDKLQQGSLVLTGSAYDHDGKTRIGSIYIVNVADYVAAKAFYDAEPFAKAGVYERATFTAVKKNRWNPLAAESAEGRGDGLKE